MAPSSLAASEASVCAGAQGKFWEYHDKLFATQGTSGKDGWQPEHYRQFADELGLSRPEFDSCLESRAGLPLIRSDMNEAVQIGVRATPAFYLQGQMFAGALPYQAFEDYLDDALAAVGAG